MSIDERSFLRIERSHLLKLRDIAFTDQKDLFARNPRFQRAYAGRLMAIALCQGAALHFLGGISGVKDFDVWSFYLEPVQSELKRMNWNRRLKSVESELPEFGAHPDDLKSGFRTRRVDLLARSLLSRVIERHGNDATVSLQAYLGDGPARTSPWYLAKKAVVGLWPDEVLGKVLWPAPA